MKNFNLATNIVISVIIYCLAYSTPCSASNTNGFGKIVGVYGTNNGAVLFDVLVDTRGALPACADNSVPHRWAIDASTVPGQSAAALLISAWTAKKRVWINGTDVCSIWNATETVQYFLIED
jgi:hypothetical protein